MIDDTFHTNSRQLRLLSMVVTDRTMTGRVVLHALCNKITSRPREFKRIMLQSGLNNMTTLVSDKCQYRLTLSTSHTNIHGSLDVVKQHTAAIAIDLCISKTKLAPTPVSGCPAGGLTLLSYLTHCSFHTDRRNSEEI